MALRYTVLILICFNGATLAGCDAGIYAPAPASDGSVVVVNKFTGTVQKVVGEHTIDVTPRPPVVPPKIHVPTLSDESIPQQPIAIVGAIEFRDGNALVRVTIRPSKSSLSDAEWADWRLHMARAKAMAGVSLEFWDPRLFTLFQRSVELNTMQWDVNLKGEYESMHTQISIPVTKDTYDDVVGWEVGWHGWPPYTGTIGKEPAK